MSVFSSSKKCCSAATSFSAFVSASCVNSSCADAQHATRKRHRGRIQNTVRGLAYTCGTRSARCCEPQQSALHPTPHLVLQHLLQRPSVAGGRVRNHDLRRGVTNRLRGTHTRAYTHARTHTQGLVSASVDACKGGGGRVSTPRRLLAVTAPGGVDSRCWLTRMPRSAALFTR